MAPRYSWKSHLKISLVAVPVKGYTANSSSGNSISFNQLHSECNSRIQYKKTCPIHGEVPSDQIVSGYQYTSGQYVIVDPAEIDKLRTPNDHAINVDAFIPADSVDPVYHTGKTYYLVPDGPVGQKPYALIRQCLDESQLHALAITVLSNKEQLVLVRPIENLLAMTVLDYAADVRLPSTFEDELVPTTPSESELDLTRTLIQALTRDDLDLTAYKDRYSEQLTRLIAAKVEGKELVAPPAVEEPAVINLMDALKASVRKVQVPESAAEKPAKPPKKIAPSHAARKVKTPAPKKKKSG